MKIILMFTIILMMLGNTPALAVDHEITYDEIVTQAIENCPYAREENIKPAILWELVEIEKAAGVPSSLRGMILAAACRESGYNTKAKGDHKFSKDKKTAMAIGILQMWPYYVKRYDIDRTNPKQSAEAWMYHIMRQIPKVKRQCKYRSDYKIWLAAWVTGVRYKKVGGRCKERPTHYRVLKKWHRNIKKTRKIERQEYMPTVHKIKEGDGC
jgi:hypothetical protein